jgi:hypothetical protein
MAEPVEIREDNPDAAYEPSDWRLRPLGLTYLGIFIFLVVAPLVLMWVYSSAVPDVSRALTVKPPAPELQTNPSQDLAAFRAEQDRKLNTYYWIDKQKGVVHIPIEQAMKSLAEQGIDGFPQGKP